MDTQTLVDALGLERLELNLFRGASPKEETRQRIYGGQVIAQALLSAYETLEDRVCHSLHCYFIRPGDPAVPIVFEVDRSRDGGSFATRRVVAIQRGQQIFNLAASFQVEEPGLEHQSPMPDAPHWDSVSDVTKDGSRRTGPIELRPMGGALGGVASPGEPVQQLWFRARDPIGPDPRMHQVILAYASDMGLMSTAFRPHGITWRTPGFQSASLDHAMWFHRPTDFNEWHLFHQASPSSSGGRGLNIGYVYRASDGALVATCAQEGLMRIRKA